MTTPQNETVEFFTVEGQIEGCCPLGWGFAMLGVASVAASAVVVVLATVAVGAQEGRVWGGTQTNGSKPGVPGPHYIQHLASRFGHCLCKQ